MTPAGLGSRIRRLRLRQQRTLQEVAGACGFTASLLSKIERGRTVPPVATLTRIAGALGVSLSALLDESRSPGTVFTPAEESRTRGQIRTEKGYTFHLFAHDRPDKSFQPFLFRARRGEVSPQALAHRGEEFVYVLRGRMRYRVGSVEYDMGPGDSLFFDSELEHDLVPVSTEVVFLAVFSERAGPAKRGGRRSGP